MTHAKEWMNPENSMWKDRKKATYFMIPFIWNVQNRQFYRQKAGKRLTRTGERREWGVTTNMCRLSCEGDENVLQLENGDVYTTPNILIYWIVYYYFMLYELISINLFFKKSVLRQINKNKRQLN